MRRSGGVESCQCFKHWHGIATRIDFTRVQQLKASPGLRCAEPLGWPRIEAVRQRDDFAATPRMRFFKHLASVRRIGNDQIGVAKYALLLAKRRSAGQAQPLWRAVVDPRIAKIGDPRQSDQALR